MILNPWQFEQSDVLHFIHNKVTQNVQVLKLVFV